MKPYVKPELFYENYELTQHIAACRWDLKLADGNTCQAFMDTDMHNNNEPFPALFTDMGRCDTTESDLTDYCYSTGADDTKRLFQS